MNENFFLNQSLASSPDNPYMKGNVEDYDYVDVEGGAGVTFADTSSPPLKKSKGRGRPRKKSAATLEEGSWFKIQLSR